MKNIVFQFAIIANCLLQTISFAQWSNNPNVNNAICTAALSQNNPQHVSDGSGGTIITWMDYRGGATSDIYVQRIDASGVVQWTVDGVAICTAVNNQRSPQLVSDGSGGAIITWEDERLWSDADIYAQRINASGVVQWTVNGVAVSTAATYQRSPQLISDGSGGAIITWQDSRSGTSDIYVQWINASGSVQWTADGVAICTATNNQRSPQLVSDGSGGAIITWHDLRGGATYDIYARRINASGIVQWVTDGVAICTAANSQTFPQLVSDGSGGAIITWQDERLWPNADIYAQRINGSGAVQWTGNGVAICTVANNQWGPLLISDGSGGAVITWIDYRGGATSDIYAQRINGSGAVQWQANEVAVCTAANDQGGPQLVSDGNGGVIITWQDKRGGFNYSIYAQRINTYGTVQWTANGVAVCTAANDQGGPKIIMADSCSFIITWIDYRGSVTTTDIYASKLDCNGSLCTPPTVFMSSNVTICNGQSATISASGGGANGPYTYSWTPMGSLNNPNISNPVAMVTIQTTYTCLITDGVSCTNTGTVAVNVNLPTVTANSTATSICSGASVTLMGGGATSYTWTGGVINGIGFVPSSTLTYTVTGTDGNGCSNTATKTITVNPLPTVIANTTATSICAGNSVTLTGGGASTYTWSGGVTDGIGFVPSSTLTYMVTGTDGNSCTNTATKTITVNPLPAVNVSATANVTCNGGSDGIVTANVSGGFSPFTYSWNNGQTAATITGLSANTYTITVTDANTCAQTSTVTLSQPNPLSANITPSSPSICKGSSATLSAGFGYSSYAWSTNSQSSVSIVVSPTANTTYSVTVSDVNGCTGSASTMITVNPVPSTPNVFAGGSTTFCQGDSVALFAPIGYASYL